MKEPSFIRIASALSQKLRNEVPGNITALHLIEKFLNQL